MKKKDISARLEAIKEFSGASMISLNSPSAPILLECVHVLGFSIAYQIDPDILLIDEVLGVGDEEFRKKSAQAMKKKILSDRTIVIVSHQAATIRELCKQGGLGRPWENRSGGSGGSCSRGVFHPYRQEKRSDF